MPDDTLKSKSLFGATSVAAPLLGVDNASLGYSDTPVIDDLSLSISSGELTAFMGPNGCGKSTLLKAMAGVLPVRAGRVSLNEEPIHDIPTRDVAKAMALLPQGPIAPEGLRVKEVVAQDRFPHQSLIRQWSREDADAVARAMAATDIEAFADRLVDALSGGQRQRVWIAMALAQDTPIVLLERDEIRLKRILRWQSNLSIP